MLVRGRWPLVAFAALAVAFAWPMQFNGYNQTAHYALVKALADGVPYIDRTLGEVGQLSSGDIARYDGHVYAVKAPGLAAASVPAYLAAERSGMRTTGDPTRTIWVLHLLGAVLPALLLVFLVYRLAERLEPGFGTVTAVLLGAATLLLPFATLFFAHALSAALGFAAFALAWREREGAPRLGLLAASGLVAGLAVVTEYQLILVAAVVGVYAVARTGPLRRALAYGAGLVAGVAPLLAFNLWAFGSPTHTPYQDYWVQEDHPTAYPKVPSGDEAWRMLFSTTGLLTLTPVLLAGIFGTALLYRRGRRAEALAIAGVVVVFCLYGASVGAFGGLGPPRYLLTLVPFASLPIALALRRFPLATVALASISVFQMAVTTATGPLAAYDGGWLRRLGDRDIVPTAASLVDITGWYAIVPFFVAVAVACAALPVRRLRGSARDGAVAVVAIAAWAGVALRATNPHGQTPTTAYVLALVLLAAGTVAFATLLSGSRWRALGTVRPAAVKPR